MTPAPKAAGAERLEELRASVAVARKGLRRERRRLQRLVQALDGELARAQQAAEMRAQGEVLKFNLARVPRGADRVRLSLPWEPDHEIEVPLRRDLTPAANLERLFRRARGLDKAAPDIARRRQEALDRQQALTALYEAMVAAQPPLPAEPSAEGQAGQAGQVEALVSLLRRARELGLRTRAGPPQSPDQAPSDVRRRIRGKSKALPAGVQRFVTASGREVFVGRSAQANDALVTRIARGRDTWMHVRDRTGAHVLLRAKGKNEVRSEVDLLACAMLAAHLSGIAKGDRVEVTWAEARHVRKVKGAPAGMVYVSDAHTRYVEVDGAVIDAFYERRKLASS